MINIIVDVLFENKFEKNLKKLLSSNHVFFPSKVHFNLLQKSVIFEDFLIFLYYNFQIKYKFDSLFAF